MHGVTLAPNERGKMIKSILSYHFYFLIISLIGSIFFFSGVKADNTSAIIDLGYRVYLPFIAKTVAQIPENGPIAFIYYDNLWKVEADGSVAKQLSYNGGYSEPAWSPRGDRIAYIREFLISGKDAYEVGIYSLVNYQFTVIVPAKLIGTLPGNYYQYSNPRWSADGLSLYYLASDGRVVGDFIHKVNIQTGAQDEYFSSFFARRFDIASQTGRIVSTDFSNGIPIGYFLNLANADGSQKVIIVPLEEKVYFGTPRWSPDEKTITVIANGGKYGDGSIAKFDPQGYYLGLFPQQISPYFYSIIDWSPNGRYLVYDSGEILYKLNTLTGDFALFRSGLEPSWGPLISPP
jgi:hypothetical protein